jgi:nicotinamidase-related amidase
MATLENRPNTALLVVDVQNAAVERAHEPDHEHPSPGYAYPQPLTRVTIVI